MPAAFMTDSLYLCLSKKTQWPPASTVHYKLGSVLLDVVLRWMPYDMVRSCENSINRALWYPMIVSYHSQPPPTPPTWPETKFRFHSQLNSQPHNLKEGFCTLFFRPRTRPKTSLQCLALEQRESKSKHCIDVLGRKNKVKNQSFRWPNEFYFR